MSAPDRFKTYPHRLTPMPVCAICGGVVERVGYDEYRCTLEKVRWTDDRLTDYVRPKRNPRRRDPDSGKFVSS